MAVEGSIPAAVEESQGDQRLAILLAMAMFVLVVDTSATTRLQLGVVEQQRGRVMALWSIAFLGLRPFASLLDGAIAHVWGVRVAGVVLATPALLAGLAVTVTALRQRRGPLRSAGASAASAASSGSLRSPEGR